MNSPGTLILRGARVIDPVNGIDDVRDVGIADGLIVPAATVPNGTVTELHGLVLCPGFIDVHTHLREPGQVHKEDILTGTRAAAAGGYTTVVAMPNTAPAIDTPEALLQVLARIRATACIRVLQTACLSVGRQGRQVTDAQALRIAGAVALTDDGSCLQDTALMLEAVAAARAAGIPVIDHCEDAGLAAKGVMNPGATAERLGLPGIPALAEDIMVARDALIAGATGWPVHVQHISTATAVALVRWARAQGIPLTAEVTPHHLLLTDAACGTAGTDAKMNPPLRSETDRQALLAALRDGTITVIATDHAPHTAAEKHAPFTQAPFGIVGLETAVALCLTHLYHAGVLSLPQLVAAFTAGPRQVLGLPYGTLSPGAPADITLLDLNTEHVIDPAHFCSRSRNTPFVGETCKGRPVATLVGGTCVFSLIPALTVAS